MGRAGHARLSVRMGLFFLLAVLVVFGLSIDVEREERHGMSWSFDRDDQGRTLRDHVLLEFVDNPGWVSKIHSRDLGEYLESLGTDRVPAEFLVTRDFGRTRGFIEVQVGERRAWKDLGGGGFSRSGTARSKSAGGIGPSPFG